MPSYIEMPKLSDTMTEGTLVKWHKKEGDKVTAGDVIAEVETDKATMEMESFDDGVLGKILAPEGSKVGIGEHLAILLGEGESADAVPEEKAAKAPKAKAEKPKDAEAKTSEKPAEPAEEKAAEPEEEKPAGRTKSSPLARKIAAEKGVDLSTVIGSGPDGRIVAADIEAAAASGKKSAERKPASGSAPATTAAAPAAPAIPAGETRQVPLSGMRKVIAARLLESKTTIPHFYLSLEIDAAPLMKLRAEANAAGELIGAPKLTVNDFILRAVALAGVKVPKANAAFGPEAITEFGSVNISVAVSIDDGLVTPVVRDAQNKSIRQISLEVKDLAARARSKKLKPDEYQGGTITVSNLGSYGIDSFYAIVNPPQAAILAVGSVVKKPVVGKDDSIVVGQRMTLGLSGDHRVVDGAVGAEFVAALKQLIENPITLLV